MDATATPRGISLAAGELGARGRQNNSYNSVQPCPVRTSSTVNGDMCGTCQGWLAFCPVCRPSRETPASHGSCFVLDSEARVEKFTLTLHDAPTPPELRRKKSKKRAP